jgi:hypothetical protein
MQAVIFIGRLIRNGRRVAKNNWRWTALAWGVWRKTIQRQRLLGGEECQRYAAGVRSKRGRFVTNSMDFLRAPQS